MMKCQIIMDALERVAPKRLAEDWDNPGLLVGSFSADIERILVALDVTDAVVEQAIAQNANMIIAHHPLIFKGIKKLRTDLPLGKRIAVLIKNDIAVAAAHTNLDIAVGGVNDVLAKSIGLDKLSTFVITSQNDDGEINSLGRFGTLPRPIAVHDFADMVKNALPTDYVRLVNAGDRAVRKVAICSGSGAEFIQRAAFMGADAYVTGDVKYHDAQAAVELGMHVIDAGHFATEFPVIEALAERLREELVTAKGKVDIITDNSSQDFFEIV